MTEQKQDRTDRVLLVAGTIALFGFHLWLSSHVDAPTVVFDENGYLGNARWFAGGSTWEMPFAPTYAAGYSLLIAPAMALLDTPDAQWRAVLAINALLLCSVFPLVTRMLQRVFAVSRRRAMAAGIVAALAPAVVATGISAVAENLVLPMVPALVLACWAMADPDRRLRSRIWFGPAVVVLYAAHPRFTLALPLALLLLIGLAVTRRGDRTVAAVNAALLVVGAVAVRVVTAAVWDARWDRVERLEGTTSTWFDLATSRSGLNELALTAIGQAWYLVIGSLGLAVVGVVVLGRDLSARRDDEPDRSRRIAVGFILTVAAAVFATSVLFFAQNQFRADHFIYGRHNDSFMPIWIAAAVAFLLDRVGARRPVALLAWAAGTAAALSAVLIATRDPADEQNVFSPFAVAAVIRFVAHDPHRLFLRASAWGLIGIGLVALLVWTSRRERFPSAVRAAALPVLVVGLVGWFTFSGFGVVRGTQDFVTLNFETWTPVPAIERLEVEELCIDASAVRGRATLSYPWFLPDVDIRSYDAVAGEEPACTFSIARLDDDARLAAGDRVATLDQGGLYELWGAPLGLALWVAPGATQDELESQGALLPEGFPAPLPGSAREGDVTILEPGDGTRSVASGGRVQVPVEVTHTGSGAPWPDILSYAKDGRVRVMAEITPLDPGGMPGARSGGELTKWMLPGDRSRIDTEILAIDAMLSPLPPGRYQVQLGIGQEGEDWFVPGGPDAAFTMVVSPPR